MDFKTPATNNYVLTTLKCMSHSAHVPKDLYFCDKMPFTAKSPRDRSISKNVIVRKKTRVVPGPEQEPM